MHFLLTVLIMSLQCLAWTIFWSTSKAWGTNYAQIFRFFGFSAKISWIMFLFILILQIFFLQSDSYRKKLFQAVFSLTQLVFLFFQICTCTWNKYFKEEKKTDTIIIKWMFLLEEKFKIMIIINNFIIQTVWIYPTLISR